MTAVIVEADRHSGLIDVLFDHNDGATRIRMTRISLPEVDPAMPRVAGLHRHEGDEIWRVRRGRIRMVMARNVWRSVPGNLS
jgi:hypothetical protein